MVIQALSVIRYPLIVNRYPLIGGARLGVFKSITQGHKGNIEFLNGPLCFSVQLDFTHPGPATHG